MCINKKKTKKKRQKYENLQFNDQKHFYSTEEDYKKKTNTR